MAAIHITDISTYKNSTWTKEVMFHPYFNDMVLAMDFDLSADIANTPNVRVTISFEIIEFRTNNFVFYHTHNADVPLGWQNLYSVLGPVTPHDIGLVWVQGNIFGLRTSVEASHYVGESGFTQFNCLAVSDIVWFRLDDVFTL